VVLNEAWDEGWVDGGCCSRHLSGAFCQGHSWVGFF
jgi:hypothetical protein